MTVFQNGDFECYDCGNFFKLKVNMERHQLMVHCYDDILNCPTCDFNCKDKETLSQHLYAHAGKYIYIFNFILIILIINIWIVFRNFKTLFMSCLLYIIQ